MNISYNWLKQYINLDLTPEELENKLTFSGIEVESVKYFGKEFEQIVVGKILEKTKHPNADKLSICKVDSGSEVVTVVCGAPNCAVNQKIAFVSVGSKLGDIKIKKTKIRGQLSSGMICSEKELGISEDHNGILILPENAPVGKNLAEFLNKKDVQFELEITPNRPDLLGFIGISRDISALLNKELVLPEVSYQNNGENIQDYLKLENQNIHKCTRYTARMIKNVEIKESPDWLKERLLSIGLRPINNVVDITNFVMAEYGHPLHAFDYDKLSGKKIIVRDAEENEKFPALDKNVYKLIKDDLVIADAENPIALAGVIGGENSHITENTKNVVIEAANFQYSSIRRTSSRYKIFTDSSYRFERDISDETADLVSKRAVQLILELADGEALCGLLDSFPQKKTNIKVNLRPARVKKILTIDISDEKIIKYLESLGLKLLNQNSDNLFFEIPYFRKDITREIDLIEEIIRLHGYNNVKTVTRISHIMDRKKFYAKRILQDLMVKYGCFEVMNWSFADPDDLVRLKLADDDQRRNTIKIKNPLGKSFSILRTTLLPGLLKNLAYNLNHGSKDIKLFELNKIFLKTDSKLAEEKYVLAAVFTGKRDEIFWKDELKEIDFYDLKGIIEDIIFEFGLQDCIFNISTENYFQKGSAADVIWKGIKIASFGKIDLKILNEYDIEQNVRGLEIYFDNIFDNTDLKEINFKPVSKYPVVVRDISFIIADNIEVESIREAIFSINRIIVKNVFLFDEYKGKNIPKGFRSLSFNIIFNSDTKTLTDDYVNNIFSKIRKKLEKDFIIKMR